MTKTWEAAPERGIRGRSGRPLRRDDGRGKCGDPGDAGELDQDVQMAVTVMLMPATSACR